MVPICSWNPPTEEVVDISCGMTESGWFAGGLRFRMRCDPMSRLKPHPEALSAWI